MKVANESYLTLLFLARALVVGRCRTFLKPIDWYSVCAAILHHTPNARPPPLFPTLPPLLSTVIFATANG
jgi:hypothetical protein